MKKKQLGFVRIFVPTWLLASAAGGIGLYRVPGSEYDMVVHFYAALGLLVSLTLVFEARRGRIRTLLPLLLFLGVTSAVTFLWEGFEKVVDVLFGTHFSLNAYDTWTDIAAGNIGALVGFIILSIRYTIYAHHSLPSRREKEIAHV